MSITTAQPDHGARAHHLDSPSSLQAKEACPGWFGIDGESEASRRGTDLHEITDAEGIKIWYDRDGYKPDGSKYTIPDHDWAGLLFCFDYLRDVFSRFEGGQYLPENRWQIDEQNTTSGFADVVVISKDGKRACVLDWKMGNHGVEHASKNAQGVAYLLGVLFKFPTLEEIEVHFVLPFQEEKSHMHVFKKAEFPLLLLRVKTIVARALKTRAIFAAGGDPEGLHPSPLLCLFCANTDKCHAVHKLVLSPGEKYQQGLVVPAAFNAAYLTDPKQAAAALKFCQVVEVVLKSIRSGITDRVMASEDFIPDGYSLVTTVRRSIVDKKAFHDTCIQFGLTSEEVMSACDFSFGPIEKIISDKAPRGKKSEAVEEFGILLNENNAIKDSDPIPSLRAKKTSKEIDVA